MLYSNTLQEISNNINTGVEYEIALFAELIKGNKDEHAKVLAAIQKRSDAAKIQGIMKMSDTASILNELKKQNYVLTDATFETQNDNVGPADIVLNVTDAAGKPQQIGLSIKYANTCTLNVTGRNFISASQLDNLKGQLSEYTNAFIQEMNEAYGSVEKWFRHRKPSTTTDKYIDLIRDAVVSNWPNVKNKTELLSAMFHDDSPIPFWVVTYHNKGYDLNTTPPSVEKTRVDDIVVEKYKTSYVAFYLDGQRIGKMQVKFNNGFIEKCKKNTPDIVEQNVPMSFGQPFSSWNFSVEK